MNAPSLNDAEHSVIPAPKARQLRWLLVLASVLFVVGISLPMITLSKFWIIQNSMSVLTGVLELFRNGQLVLGAVVAGFSILLPILKIGVLFKLCSPGLTDSPIIQHYLHLMHSYGRWAMLDVLVVAVLIVTVKLGAIASIEVHSGLYAFGASVLMIMLITSQVVRLTRSS
ncbi:paraquat-inducible protein A [Marinobacterium stanieri]|uniref:paraquat-inducible protein A n=1 Tax=Marinobacterium stanieri TaxID=49186 RepID=UPI00025587D1|nr:paraquat-inducible protein A [Marinobacterium stanieri]